jgi:hypothetical protein
MCIGVEVEVPVQRWKYQFADSRAASSSKAGWRGSLSVRSSPFARVSWAFHRDVNADPCSFVSGVSQYRQVFQVGPC